MIVLASASPRRQELLQNARIPFTVEPADVPEIMRPDEAPVEFACRLAREKATTVLARHAENGTVVLGADTIVVVDQHVLGKPEDSQDAARMLRLLAGRTHQVTTGVCLAGKDFMDVRSETTHVTFDPLTDADIAAYIGTGEPMDKAGAYAIQGIASRWVPRIEGCYFNVVGLPVPLVWRMLRQNDVI